MVIRYADGSYDVAVIHSLEGGTIRAAVEGIDGLVDFRLAGDKWVSDIGVAISFEFPTDSGKAEEHHG